MLGGFTLAVLCSVALGGCGLVWLFATTRRRRSTARHLQRARSEPSSPDKPPEAQAPPSDRQPTTAATIRVPRGADRTLGRADGQVASDDDGDDAEAAAEVLATARPSHFSLLTMEKDLIDRLLGERVEIHGLRHAPELNNTFGVALRYDQDTRRFAVRKELARADEAATVTVRAENLRAAPRRDVLAELQQLVDAAPAGARVTLPRGKVALAAGDSADATGATLVIKTALTLAGMGSRTGGTVLGFGVEVGDDVVGDLVELSGLHVNGALDVSPGDVRRVRLSKVSVTAPADEKTALYVDEIGRRIPKPSEAFADGRVVLEDCWVRGGDVGVWINAVGCTLRRCRVQGAASYGVRANATFAVEGCTIGDCAKSGKGGGILTRAAPDGVTQVRAPNGINENRIQRDQYDKGYKGYNPDCLGCVGRCTCSAVMAMAGLFGGAGPISWGDGPGLGRWQKL